jgi:hypothetical protein
MSALHVFLCLTGAVAVINLMMVVHALCKTWPAIEKNPFTRQFLCDGAVAKALDHAEVIALDGATVYGEAGSVSFIYKGACGRFAAGAAVHVYEGVRAYARNKSTVIDCGGVIFDTGDPCVFRGNEPARVVAEPGSTVYVHKGAVVIIEPECRLERQT